MEKTATIESLGEFQLIRQFFAPADLATPQDGVVVGVGDDAAVITIPRTQQLLVTTDTMVEGIHFTSQADPFLLGQKALAVNLSDLAAMGGNPHWYLLSLTLPATTPVSWVEALARGLQLRATQHTTQRLPATIALVGGNTTSSPSGITLTITLLGLIGKNRAVTRSGAQVGDHIFVTGTIGDAALGLDIQRGVLTDVAPAAQVALQQRLNLPNPPIDLAIALQESALSRSAVDLSDGLVADLQHLCTASKVGARIHAEQVPLSPAAHDQVQRHGNSLLARILNGGEDYELLFTAAASATTAIMTLAQQLGTHVTAIGIITAEPDIVVTHHGQTMTLTTSGWSHF